MKRKASVAILLTGLVVTTGLSGCFLPVDKGTEFEEYKEIVTTIVKDATGEDFGAEAKRINSLQNSNKFLQASAVGVERQATDVINALHTSASELRDNVAYAYEEAFSQTLYISLLTGDAITSFCGAKKFYGVSIQTPFDGHYVMTESNGQIKTTYSYTETGNEIFGGKEVFSELEIYFENNENYEFYSLQAFADGSTKVIVYGNSDREFYSIFYRQNDAYAKYVNAGSAYVTYDQASIDSAFSLVSDEFSKIDEEKIKSVKEKVDYVVSEMDYKKAEEKYFKVSEEERPDDGTKDDLETGYDIRDGVFFGWKGDKRACPETVEIPATADALYHIVDLPSQVKKLVIPASVTAVKILESDLSQIQTTSNGALENQESYVTVDAEDLQIATEGSFLTEIVVENSPIFSINNHCLATKDGVIIYIPENPSITSLKLGVGYSTIFAEQSLLSVKLPSLKNFDYTVRYGVDPLQSEDSVYIHPLEMLEMSGADYRLTNLTVRGIRAFEGSLFSFPFGSFGTGLKAVERLDVYGSGGFFIDAVQTNPVTEIFVCEGMTEVGIRGVAKVNLPASLQKLHFDAAEGSILQMPVSRSVFESNDDLCGKFGVSDLSSWIAETAGQLGSSVTYFGVVYQFETE